MAWFCGVGDNAASVQLGAELSSEFLPGTLTGPTWDRTDMEILRWDIGDATVVRVGELDATAALQGLIPDLDPAEVSRASWLAPHFIDEVGRLKGLV